MVRADEGPEGGDCYHGCVDIGSGMGLAESLDNHTEGDTAIDSIVYHKDFPLSVTYQALRKGDVGHTSLGFEGKQLRLGHPHDVEHGARKTAEQTAELTLGAGGGSLQFDHGEAGGGKGSHDFAGDVFPAGADSDYQFRRETA